ncbi:MAG: lysoplasmalogenase [Anaerosomatales bacterium]|nr:lysoplasmalogenase [Anaerosomatales bacterium]
MIAGTALTLLALGGLLRAEAARSQRWRAVLKPLASAGLVWAAVGGLHPRLPEGAYGWLLLAGIALSVAGDVLLIPRARAAFLLGMGAFAVAHVTYVAAFLTRVAPAWWHAAALVVFLVAGHLVWRRLEPDVTGGLRLPVRGYVLVVSVMAATSAGSLGSVMAGAEEGAAVAAFIGGLLFYASDLFVARQRFVAERFMNKAVGLPLYYVGQLLIASQVLGVGGIGL